MKGLSKATLLFKFCLLLLFLFCGCGKPKNNIFRIGIDFNWYPVNFYGQNHLVNGFIEELLLELSKESGLEFEVVTANWDALFNENLYDAILTSLPLYNFNIAKYDFSKNFLDIGPVLVVSSTSKVKGLKQLSNQLVGSLAGDEVASILQQFPKVVGRTVPSIASLLDDVAIGQFAGALLDRLLAKSYIRDLYASQLKIVGVPLNDKGLHLAVQKNKMAAQLKLFDSGLQRLINEKKLDALLKKWQLD